MTSLTGAQDGSYSNSDSVYRSVQQYYGKVLQTTKDLKTSACTTGSRPNQIIRDILKKVPNEINSKFYGCGNPIPLGIEGLSVLDLGSGSGRDCYIAAQLVGPNGFVTGIDMTEEQLSVANAHIDEYMQTLNYPKTNLRFVKGFIEFLPEAGIAQNSIDMVISNCVLNLSPNKKQVLQSVYSVLKEGGEFYFSDVYCDRRLPEDVRNHEILLGECIAGALYIGDFLRLCRETGFLDPRTVSSSEVLITDAGLKEVIGEARFYSITYRLFKLKNLEPQCEDYGQYAIYKGTMQGNKHSYQLDDHHKFEKGKPTLVCGNTASMLSETWLAKYFDVIGNRDIHYGVFPCGPAIETGVATSSSKTGSSCCA
jgi:arsenite methyltransferase